MKIKLFLAICLTAAFFSLSKPEPCFGASTVTVSASGDSFFLIQGDGIESAAAFDIMVSYDKTTLANPEVMQGSFAANALMSVNLNVPGTIRISMVTTSPVTGSGAIATLEFDRIGESSGKIISLNVKLADINGRAIPVATRIINPEQDQTSATAEAASTDQSAKTAMDQPRDSGTSMQTPVPRGGILAPQTEPRQDEIVPGSSGEFFEEIHPDEPIMRDPKSDRGAEETTDSPVRKIHAHTSVLDRFSEYRGEASVGKYLSFFEHDGLSGFSQEPPVALSDGKARLKLTFILPPGDRSASDTAIMGARLISMKRDPGYTNAWIVEAEPEKGEYSASITVSQSDFIVLYPLAVAPKKDIDLDKSGAITEEDFILFLRERGNLKTPRFDLNGDGKRDYIDDYIFTANYFAARNGNINQML